MGQIQDAAGSNVTADVTLTTTTEAVICTTPLLHINRNSALVFIAAKAQLVTGTATTTVTPRIRRGTTITDTLVGEANAVTIQAAVGSTEQYGLIMFDQLTAEQVVQYSFTLTQAGASADGTAKQGTIFAIAV